MKVLAGLAALLYFFVVMPMWFYMLHWCLSSLNAPAYVWGCFWAYVPLSIILMAMMRAGDAAKS